MTTPSDQAAERQEARHVTLRLQCPKEANADTKESLRLPRIGGQTERRNPHSIANSSRSLRGQFNQERKKERGPLTTLFESLTKPVFELYAFAFAR